MRSKIVSRCFETCFGFLKMISLSGSPVSITWPMEKRMNFGTCFSPCWAESFNTSSQLLLPTCLFSTWENVQLGQPRNDWLAATRWRILTQVMLIDFRKNVLTWADPISQSATSEQTPVFNGVGTLHALGTTTRSTVPLITCVAACGKRMQKDWTSCRSIACSASK